MCRQVTAALQLLVESGSPCRSRSRSQTGATLAFVSLHVEAGLSVHADHLAPGRFAAYRLVFALETNFSNAVLNGTANADNVTLQLADIGLVFDNQDNLALLEDVRGNRSFRAYDFEPKGPPFTSVYRDSDGFPVPVLRYSESPLDGALGPLDVEFLEGSLVQEAGCGLGGNDVTESWADDPLAPWRSCVGAADLCTPSDQGICFQGNTTGVCLAGNNSGAICHSSLECGDRGTCAPQRSQCNSSKARAAF
jgi:hypothetical protein